ncbi:MAG: IPT/TIG domain-containing protein [bacterium]|nr:IPT/TIG domain-containing protein [bacterium]
MKRFQHGRILRASACAALLLAAAGCEYDSPVPMWYQDHAADTGPAVTGLEPARAAAGVNTVTIRGERFSPVPDSNRVYFSGAKAEIISATATSLLIRRPTVSGTLNLKVVHLGALEVGTFDGYPVDAVSESYGGFIDGAANNAILVDAAENIYIFRTGLMKAFKVAPDGTQSLFMAATARGVTDAIPAADGQFVLLSNNAKISKVNPADGVETEWVAKAPKRFTVGDVDANGNIYMAAKNTDLYVSHPDGSFSAALGAYATHDVKKVRVRGNHVYVVAEHATAEPKMAVYRHAILDAAGTLGPQEVVLDRAASGAFSAAVFKDVMFSASGDMFVATDAANPILQVKADGTLDTWYKGIVKGSAERLAAGNGRYAYMLQLDGTRGDLIRIDMGPDFGPALPPVGMF